jgi:hypothetical protein
MGWFFRKSVGLGPLRVNFSKSGIGYSVGVRGARFGVGPRGNYVRLGRGGVYYQKYLSPSGSRTRPESIVSSLDVSSTDTPVVTASASQLNDSTSAGLLAEIQEKHGRFSFAPLFGVVFAVFLILLLSTKPPIWVPLSVVPVLVFLYGAIARGDYERKLVVLNYDLDGDARAKYVALLNAIQTVASSARMWRVTSQDKFVDSKYHGGAGTVLDRKPVSFRLTAPPFVKTEVAVWSLPLGGQNLYFFPDRILVYEGSQVGAVPYEELSVSVDQVRFVEDGGVPSDSRVVDRTWQYVNRSGGPDRRFSSNREIPVVLYGEISLRSDDGMNILLQSSDPEKAAPFKAGLDAYIESRRLTAVEQ